MPAFRPLSHTFKEIFIFTLVVLVYSCNHKKDTNKQLSLKSDSIEFLLNEVKADSVSEKEKSVLLEKAYGQAQKLTNDSLKNKYLKKLSFILRRNHDSSLFRRINKEAIHTSNKTNDSSSLAVAYWDLADFYRYRTVHRDSAYYQYGKAEKIYSNLGDEKNFGLVLISKAWVQNLIGDYTGSDLTITKAIKKLKPLNDFENLKRCYTLMGDNAKL